MMKTKILFTNYIMWLLILTSCSTNSTNKEEDKPQNVKASIYYYDSAYKDTLLIQTVLIKEESTRTTGDTTFPITTLSNDYINIVYSFNKIDYVDYENNVSVSYRTSPTTFITTESNPHNTTDVIIGTNNYSTLSIFIK